MKMRVFACPGLSAFLLAGVMLAGFFSADAADSNRGEWKDLTAGNSLAKWRAPDPKA